MTSAALNTIAVVLLLAANAFFVAAEFALVRVRRFRMESRAEQGSAAARLTLRMLDNLEAYLAACQLGITMASLGLGWVGEPAVAALLEPMFRALGHERRPAPHRRVPGRVPAVLVAAHRGRRAGPEDVRDPSGRAHGAGRGLPAAGVLPALLPAQLGA